MKYKNIVFVTPEPIKDMGNFRNYLIENTEYLVTYHFFHGYSDNKSYMEKYEKGRLILRKEFFSLKVRINIFRIVYYWTILSYILLKHAKSETFVIVEKPFFLTLNSILSKIKGLKFVFWIGDYYPEAKGFMRIYNYLVDYYNKNLKYVLYESPAIEKAYLNGVKNGELKNKYRDLVTLGMKKEAIGKSKPRRGILLGFIGVLRPMQGLDLIFKYLSETKRKDISLEVIGSGYYLDHYKNLAKEINIGSRVKFYGFVKDMKPIVKNWDIGLALYENKKENVSVYCEPTKIKDYLEYGLPVITTKATYFYKELRKYSAGEAIDETVEDLDKAIDKIKNNYQKYLSGIEKIIDDYDYKRWYEKRFKFLEV